MTTTAQQNTRSFTVTKHDDHHGTIRLAVTGELDTTTDTLLALVANATDPQHPNTAIIDLDAVTFLDAAGIRALLQDRNRALRRHAELRTTGAHDLVATVLHITRADSVLNVPQSPRSGTMSAVGTRS